MARSRSFWGYSSPVFIEELSAHKQAQETNSHQMGKVSAYRRKTADPKPKKFGIHKQFKIYK